MTFVFRKTPPINWEKWIGGSQRGWLWLLSRRDRVAAWAMLVKVMERGWL